MRVFLSMVFFSCSACGQAPDLQDSTGLCEDFRKQISKDPSVVAETASRGGERRFLAVRGFTTTVPGIEDTALIKRRGYIALEGTTDAPTDTSCEAYQSEATAYAERYNTTLVEILD